MSSKNSARWRQLSWVTYGNAYLSHYAPFSSWQNHRGLWEITAEFRLFDGTLVARDGFEWLWWLRQNGIVRLSMELWDGLEDAGRYCNSDAQVIVCHYSNHDEIWGRFDEASEAVSLAHQSGSSEIFFGRHFHFPDRFVLVACRGKQPDVPGLEWKKIHKTVKSRLSRFEDFPALVRMPPLESGKWFCAFGSKDDNGRLPTMPPTSALWIAHNLLFGLVSIRSHFDNVTYFKNESSPYHYSHISPEDQERLDELSRTVDELIAMAQCQAATETGWRLTKRTPEIAVTPASSSGRSAFVSANCEASADSWRMGEVVVALSMLALILAAVWHFPKAVALIALSLFAFHFFRQRL